MLSFLVSSGTGEPSTRFARMGFGKTVLIVAIAALWTAPEGPTEGSDRATDRPNIILIMADDIGYECFGCYGSEQYATPRIDALAREGMRLTHFHAQPLCTPTRVKLMTGLSNVRNYAAFSVLRPGQRTIGDYFKEAGYQTMIGGKWQLLGAEHYAERFRGKGVRPEDVGFQRHCLWQVDRLGKRYWNPLLRIDGTTKQFRAEDYGPRIVTEHLLRFIRSHRDEPFFVYYPMILVHNPFVDPRRNTGRMRGNGQKNFELMVAEMDELVGRITDEVDRLGIADRTLIMFLGDNGTNRRIKSKLGRRIVRGGKGLTTDAGTHVPFIARWTRSHSERNAMPRSRGRIRHPADAARRCRSTDPLRARRTQFLPATSGKEGKSSNVALLLLQPATGEDDPEASRVGSPLQAVRHG